MLWVAEDCSCGAGVSDSPQDNAGSSLTLGKSSQTFKPSGRALRPPETTAPAAHSSTFRVMGHVSSPDSPVTVPYVQRFEPGQPQRCQRLPRRHVGCCTNRQMELHG